MAVAALKQRPAPASAPASAPKVFHERCWSRARKNGASRRNRRKRLASCWPQGKGTGATSATACSSRWNAWRSDGAPVSVATRAIERSLPARAVSRTLEWPGAAERNSPHALGLRQAPSHLAPGDAAAVAPPACEPVVKRPRPPLASAFAARSPVPAACDARCDDPIDPRARTAVPLPWKRRPR